nr:uncharacterized protein LOC108384657 [Manis javanica]
MDSPPLRLAPKWSHSLALYQPPNRLISISTIVQLLACTAVRGRPLRRRYKGLSEPRTCSESAHRPASRRNHTPRPAAPGAPVPPPPPTPLLFLPGDVLCNDSACAGPSGRAWGPAFSTFPPPLPPLTALSFQARRILLEIIIPLAVKYNHQTTTGKVTSGFLPNKRSPPLAEAATSGRSALGVLLALRFPPRLEILPDNSSRSTGACDPLIAACKIKIVP